MPKEGEIHGAQEDFLLRFLDHTQPAKGKQTQTKNAGQQDAYLKLARALVLAFGAENTLGDVKPTEFVNVEFADIPAAVDMPPLGDAAAERRRDEVIAGFVNPVRNFYKRKRHQAKQGGGGPARLTMKHIQRVVDAFSPPPVPPKELDIYQKFYRSRYSDALESSIKAKEVAAAGDELVLASLRKGKGGFERAFASQMYEREKENVKAVVRQKRDEVHAEELKKYNTLWGAPLDMPGNSRAWVYPEASSFLQALLNWLATRFGVSLVLTIAGVDNGGIPDANSLFASGHTKPGAPPLANVVAMSLSDTRLRMCQYVRDMLTGEYPTGASSAEHRHKVEVDVDEQMEDLTARLNLERDPMHVVRKEEIAEWAQGEIPESSNRGASSDTLTVAGGADVASASMPNRSDEPQETDSPEDLIRRLKGKGVDRTGAGTDNRSRRAVGDGRVNAYHPLKAAVASGSGDVDIGRDAMDRESDDPFGTGILDDNELMFAGQSAAWPTTFYSRASSPETTTTDYAIRRAGLSRSVSEAGDDDVEAMDVDTHEHLFGSPVADMADVRTGEELARAEHGREEMANGEGTEMSATDSEVEKVQKADAYQASLFKDRRLAKTKEKSERTLLLGAIARSRAGESRKRQRLPPKVNPDDPATNDAAAAAGTTKRKATGAKRGGVKLTKRAAEKVIRGGGTASNVKGRTSKRRKARLESEDSDEEGVFTDDGEEEDEEEEENWEADDIRSAEGAGGEDGVTLDANHLSAEPTEAADIDAGRMQTQEWVSAHEVDESGVEYKAAWRTYTAKFAESTRRKMIVHTIQTLAPPVQPVYASLVDCMESLLRDDLKWDMGTGGYLDSKKRPRAASSITSRRGGVLQGEVPVDWGEKMIEWWISLQPVERGEASAVGDLSAPATHMAWGSLAEARGYKGAFLLVWCMMYWARSGLHMEDWTAVARDMIRVFEVLHTVRNEACTTPSAEDGPRKKMRLDDQRVVADGEETHRQRASKKPGPFGWR
ncbi:unnamed protein product [Peniophora sp. CBMAI 1063]|nr:unnamed protein product [Peniophora sp. CBMAI 1063]